MSDVQIKTAVVRFPCMTWEVQGESIQPIKGSWALPPMHLKHIFQRLGVEDKIKGLVSCPNCAKTSIVTSELVTEDKIAHTATLQLLRCSDCPLACEAVFEDWDQRKLYCVAYSTTVQPLIKEYFHGYSTQEVADQFWNGHLHDRDIVEVIGIAIVIGYFVDDKEGLKLHV